MSQGALLLAGFVASCGAVLVLAGLSKLYRGVRGIEGGTAIRRLLRMPRRQWRRVELAAAGLEFLTGTVVCARVYPVAGGVVMAALGAVFCAVLGYTRIKRVPGDCGCLNWRKAAAMSAGTVTWRAIARGGLVLGAGVADAIAGSTGASAFHRAWFDAGVLAGVVTFVLLSAPLVTRTPVCHRRLWRPARAALRMLATHETFAAMAASAGPFGSLAGYRRAGCTEEFWLTPAPGSGGTRAVIFRISYPVPDGAPAVHATMQDMSATAAGHPPRMISVRDALAAGSSNH